MTLVPTVALLLGVAGAAERPALTGTVADPDGKPPRWSDVPGFEMSADHESLLPDRTVPPP
jgi:hypothetical protein